MDKTIYIVIWQSHTKEVKSASYYNKRCALKAVNDLKANKLSLAEIWLTTYKNFRKVKNEVFNLKED